MFISIWQSHTPTHTNVVCKSTKSQWDAFGNHRRWAGCWRAGNWKQSRLIGLISPSGEFPRQTDWRQLAGDFDTVLGVMGKFLISLLCASLSHLSSLHSFSSFCPNQGGAYFSLSFRLWLGNQSDYFIEGSLTLLAEEEACPRSYSCILQNLFFPAVMREWGVLHLCNRQTILKLGVYTKNEFFFHIEEEITALQRKQLCRINLLPLLLNSSLEQLSQYVKCQLHWLLAPPFSSSSPLLVSQVRWTKCTERMPRKGIKDVQNLVTRKQDRRQKQNFDTYTKN